MGELRRLTVRELKVLKLCTLGKTNVEIAKILEINPHAVKAHMCSIFEKMNVRSRVAAAVKAVKLGLIK